MTASPEPQSIKINLALNWVFGEINEAIRQCGRAPEHLVTIREVLIATKGQMPSTAGYKNKTTSKEAAKKIEPKLSGLRADVLGYIIKQGDTGATGTEISKALGMLLYTAKPRCSELRDGGLIVDSGRTRDNGNGSPEIVWIAARKT